MKDELDMNANLLVEFLQNAIFRIYKGGYRIVY